MSYTIPIQEALQGYVDSTDQFVVISSDVTKRSISDYYSSATFSLQELEYNPYDLTPEEIFFPSDWVGSFAIDHDPSQHLDVSIGRGMRIKDIALTDNPAFILENAPGYDQSQQVTLADAFTKLASEMNDLGVEYVQLPQWTWGTWDETNFGILDHNDVFGPFSDSDFSVFVEEAAKFDISVMTISQIQGLVDPDTRELLPSPEITADSAASWLEVYRNNMLEKAEIYEDIGLSYWTIDCFACTMEWLWPKEEQIVSIYVNFYNDLIEDIREKFSGEVGLMWGPITQLDPNIMTMVDYVKTNIDPWSYEELGEDFSVSDYYDLIINQSAYTTLEYIDSFTDKIFVDFSIQSRANATTDPGYLEETACTAKITTDRDLDEISNDVCVQMETQPSFSLMGLTYEASLRAINDLELSSTIIAMPGEYWVTEQLMPQTAFPQIGASPKNKIAEDILYNWYKDGSDADAFIVQRGIVGKGSGYDKYILSNWMVDSEAEITITDSGDNALQFINGLEVSSSMVAANAMLLTLSNGAVITVLDAASYDYTVGGNPLENEAGLKFTYQAFVEDVLGVDMPTGSQISHGDAVTITSDMTFGNDVVVTSGTPVSGTDAADEFQLDVSDGGVFEINGFDTTEDSLALSGIASTDNQILSELVGDVGVGGQAVTVQYDPFAQETFINLGLDADGEVVAVTLVGITQDDWSSVALV